MMASHARAGVEHRPEAVSGMASEVPRQPLPSKQLPAADFRLWILILSRFGEKVTSQEDECQTQNGSFACKA
jgi:hypothetical protein